MINLFHKAFCDNQLGQYYRVVVTDKGVNHYDGTDLFPLFPSDTMCDFLYVRQIGDVSLHSKDGGDCFPDTRNFYKYRIVYYNVKEVNELSLQSILSRIFSSISSTENINIKFTNLINDKVKLHKQEYKNKKLENKLIFNSCTYIAFEIEATALIEQNCKEICL